MRNTKVKIFRSADEETLEQKINEFLAGEDKYCSPFLTFNSVVYNHQIIYTCIIQYMDDDY